MGKIQVLSDVLASQVAAGEVVERPASVVKELIENSLDAGAASISIMVRRGGSALLRIVDDGAGMSREDALMSLERHATSKLRTSADLASILTKGFRGEALPSIASVSKFILSTREKDALCGTRVTVEGGVLTGTEDAGDAPGTSIEVRQLFYNVPARRKFLRSEDTEFSHIEQQVRVQALAHPETGFSLTRDDRLLFHLPPHDTLAGRIAGLAGAELAGQLLEIPSSTAGPLTVSGFLGRPGLWRSSRALQFTFLNRRPVESPVFTHALRAGYGETLPRGNSPVCFLMIGIDPAAVDVNVHPAKREVRFRNGQAVQAALAEIIARTVHAGGPGGSAWAGFGPGTATAAAQGAGSSPPAVPARSPSSPAPAPADSAGAGSPVPVPRWTPPVVQAPLLPPGLPSVPSTMAATPASPPDVLSPPAKTPALRHVWEGVPARPAPPGTVPGSGPAARNSPTASGTPDTPSSESGATSAAPDSTLPLPLNVPPGTAFCPPAATHRAAEPAAPSASASPAPPPGFRPLALLGSAYVLLESGEGLVLLDHRAAWERILYEEARSRAASRGIVSQGLLTPLTIPLSPREFDFLKPWLPALRRMGLGIEEFGSNTVLVDSLPAGLPEADGTLPALISALVEDLRLAHQRSPQRRLDDAAIAAAVARQAARQQPPQALENAAGLVTRLMACSMPYCRPDGQPTLIQFSWQELARKFGRS